MEEKREITIQDVINFIIQNSENTEFIDKINKITYPFTSKFKSYGKKEDYEEDGYRDGF